MTSLEGVADRSVMPYDLRVLMTGNAPC